jgi:hypothetical protein
MAKGKVDMNRADATTAGPVSTGSQLSIRVDAVIGRIVGV